MTASCSSVKHFHSRVRNSAAPGRPVQHAAFPAAYHRVSEPQTRRHGMPQADYAQRDFDVE
jgi:hypothetical protein